VLIQEVKKEKGRSAESGGDEKVMSGGASWGGSEGATEVDLVPPGVGGKKGGGQSGRGRGRGKVGEGRWWGGRVEQGAYGGAGGGALVGGVGGVRGRTSQGRRAG